METEVLVALVAGVVSLLVAILSLVATTINSRSHSKTAQTVERLKHSLQVSSKGIELSDSELSSSLKFLKEALTAMQVYKDELQLILSAVDSSLRSYEAIERISAAGKQLLRVYQEGYPDFNNLEKEALHAIKSEALPVEAKLIQHLRKKEYASEISEEMRNRLIGLRAEITDSQNELRDSRIERIVQRGMEA